MFEEAKPIKVTVKKPDTLRMRILPSVSGGVEPYFRTFYEHRIPRTNDGIESPVVNWIITSCELDHPIVQTTEPQLDSPVAVFLDEMMPKLFAHTIRQAREVSQRFHINADRHERVGLFLTDLRRAIHELRLPSDVMKAIISTLCRKNLWHDIGVLSQNQFNTFIPALKSSTFVGWLESGLATVGASENQLEGDLKQLSESFVMFGQQISQAQRINTEADQVFDSLCSLIESANER